MSEIPRYRMDLYEGESSNKGLWVQYEDHAKLIAELEKEHTADVKLARFISFNLGKRWQAGAVGSGVGGYNPGISGGSGTIEANVTKGYLLDGTEVSVENLGAEGGVTIHPQPVRHEDHAAAIKAAVLAERVRCLDIVENIHGVSVGQDGYRWLEPRGELVSRSRIETAIRWVKVK